MIGVERNTQTTTTPALSAIFESPCTFVAVTSHANGQSPDIGAAGFSPTCSPDVSQHISSQWTGSLCSLMSEGKTTQSPGFD